MPEEPTENKDHYSYEEIMDHLKRVHSRHGVKSKKKRRRRSHQPLKEKRRSRLFTTLAILTLFLIGAVVAANFFFSHLYYQTERFRVELGNFVERTTGLETEFQGRFTVSGSRFVNKQLRIKGRENLIVFALDFRGIRATIPLLSLLGSSWDADVLVDEVDAKLQPARDSGTSVSSRFSKDLPSVLSAGLGFRRVPETMILNRLAIQRMTIEFGSDARRPHALRDITLLLKRTPTNYFIDASSGQLTFGSWPPFTLESADATLNDGGEVTILESHFVEDTGGICELTGALRLFGDTPGADVTADLQNIPVNQTVNPSWRDRVVGTVSGRVVLRSGFRENDPFLLSGTLSGDRIALKKLDLLTELSHIAGLDLFQRLECEEFSLKFEQDRDRLRLYDISAGTEDFFLLQGELTVHSDERIEGAFELGIPNTLLDRFHHKIPSFFEARGSNVSWVKFNLSGTLREPQDDLIPMFRENYPPPPTTRGDTQIPQPRTPGESDESDEPEPPDQQ